MKKKLDENGEEVEGMNIPTSVGAARHGEDKSGVPCLIYDVIVNTSVIQETRDDKTGKYRDFICQLGIQCIEQKYKEELDKRYKLPKLEYMGTVESQYIQDRKSMPKIEEVSSSSGKKTGSASRSKLSTKSSLAEVIVADRILSFQLYWLVNKRCGDETNLTAKNVTTVSADNLDSLDRVLFIYNGDEYKEPLDIAPAEHCGMLFEAEIHDQQFNIHAAEVGLSPFKVQIKLPGYGRVTVHLACAVQPASAFCQLTRPTGFVSKLVFQLVASVDRTAWDDVADAGSKPWLLAQALATDDSSENGGNPMGVSTNPYRSQAAAGTTTGAARVGNVLGDSYQEDKFHLRLPDDVDPYTGVKLDGDAGSKERKNVLPPEEQILPEDRFHQKDASSSYLINQREQAKKDKWDKYEKYVFEERKSTDLFLNYGTIQYTDSCLIWFGSKLSMRNDTFLSLCICMPRRLLL